MFMASVADCFAALVFVIDLSDVDRFLEVKSELKRISMDPQLNIIPMLILFHKYDLITANFNLENVKKYLFQDIDFKSKILIKNSSINVLESIYKINSTILSVLD